MKDSYKKYFTLQGWKERLRATITKKYLISAGLGFLLFFVSLVLNYFAGTYAANHVSSTVQDLLLDNIPQFNVTLIFIWATLLGIGGTTVLCLMRFEDIPYASKSIALFILIRAAFITLTHLAPFSDSQQLINSSFIVGKLSFGGDLFFSGHTGLPFLLALMYWNKKWLRYLFLAASVALAVIVILGHIHYSIDVFAAYFITFAIYRITIRLFASDYGLFKQNQNEKGMVRGQ